LISRWTGSHFGGLKIAKSETLSFMSHRWPLLIPELTHAYRDLHDGVNRFSRRLPTSESKFGRSIMRTSTNARRCGEVS
jgi:hypothetical protein